MGSVEYLEHTADMRLKVTGLNISDLFTTLAGALSGEITDGPDNSEKSGHVYEFVLKGSSEEKCVQLANELLFRIQVRGRIPLAVRVQDTGHEWNIRMEEAECVRVTGEIKAATYHDVRFSVMGKSVCLEMTFDR